jgi:IMP dehydrogenase
MAEVEIGIGKSGRRAYGLDDLSIVPSRRTRAPEVVDIGWQIDAFAFELPFLSSAIDSVASPATVVELGRLGGCGVLDLEGLWTRYADPEPLLDEVGELPADKAALRLDELYAQPIDPALVGQRIREIKDAGVVSCAAVSPPRTEALSAEILRAELDLLVIHGRVVSAEHVSRHREPLNLKRFIRTLPMPVVVGGCTSYQAALHLMRTGAAGVLVGVGRGGAHRTQQQLGIGVAMATAIADARGARMRHLDETGVYCHVIADGTLVNGGDVAKAVACGADAVMLGAPLAAAAEAPGRGFHWSKGGGPLPVDREGSLEEVVRRLAAGLRTSMATAGYETLKEFQKAEVVVQA